MRPSRLQTEIDIHGNRKDANKGACSSVQHKEIRRRRVAELMVLRALKMLNNGTCDHRAGSEMLQDSPLGLVLLAFSGKRRILLPWFVEHWSMIGLRLHFDRLVFVHDCVQVRLQVQSLNPRCFEIRKCADIATLFKTCLLLRNVSQALPLRWAPRLIARSERPHGSRSNGMGGRQAARGAVKHTGFTQSK